MRYAIVQNNVIVNVCIWDGVTPFDPGPTMTLLPVSALPEGADIGWIQAGGAWSAPSN